ncbi:968_t:CDS:2, partial [Entrophospora sp. SA101]
NGNNNKGTVGHFFKDIQQVISYLNKDETMPQYGEKEKIRIKNAKIIAPWHDTTGNTKWNGQRYYRKANEYDDNIELIGKAKFIKDDFDLHPS